MATAMVAANTLNYVSHVEWFLKHAAVIATIGGFIVDEEEAIAIIITASVME